MVRDSLPVQRPTRALAVSAVSVRSVNGAARLVRSVNAAAQVGRRLGLAWDRFGGFGDVEPRRDGRRGAALGEAAATQKLAPSISANGSIVVFESDATNLVLGDANGFRDAFFRDRGRGLLGDLDNDGDVDAADLAILLGSWGPWIPCPPLHPADLNMDCKVGAEDLAILLGNWTE